MMTITSLNSPVVHAGYKSVVNFGLLPQPPQARANDNLWPQVARVRIDHGHNKVQAHFGKDPQNTVSCPRSVSRC
ncbi:predicted protein [Lichtheimia corymbifera JMRC:FSU:9682]|uniref:Uncharacterized protein n=1 Tax=Lichtheimia corymbifera JMRC:FSU:9682 TaxID=1263082 RepID=A0A068RJ24_9FUNG|nr:predicted protein [Lichtheimia corymbifera JMRC:FSU:9682]